MGENVALILFGVIALAVAAQQVVDWLTRRKWRAHEELPYLAEKLGFERVADRFLHNMRIIRYAGETGGCKTKVESGAGPGAVYARIDFLYPKEVPLGLRISSEHEEGLFTKVMRLREVEVGLRHFDSQFILLSRDEERLKNLLDRDCRRMLLDLRNQCRDVRLNDEGVHLQLFGSMDREKVLEIIERGSQLASHAFNRAETILDTTSVDVDTPAAFTPIPGSLNAVGTGEFQRAEGAEGQSADAGDEKSEAEPADEPTVPADMRETTADTPAASGEEE